MRAPSRGKPVVSAMGGLKTGTIKEARKWQTGTNTQPLFVGRKCKSRHQKRKKTKESFQTTNRSKGTNSTGEDTKKGQRPTTKAPSCFCIGKPPNLCIGQTK